MTMLVMNSMSGYSIDSDCYSNIDGILPEVLTSGAGADGPDLPFLEADGGSRYMSFPLVSRPKTIFVGFWYWAENNQDNHSFLNFGDPDGVRQGAFRRLSGGGLVAARNLSDEVGTRSQNVLNSQVWDFFECKYRCDDVTGDYIMRINGKEVLRTTGVDSQQGTTDAISHVFFNSVNPDSYRLSHVWIWDDQGSEFNDFIGPRRLVQLYPSGSGGNQDWARSTSGSTNWELVLDDPVTSTDYVEITSTGDTDQYQFDDISADVNQLECVQVSAAIIQTDTHEAMVEVFLESTGTEVNGRAINPAGDTRTFVRQLYETDPNGSISWTIAALDIARVGIRAVASTN